MAHSIQTTQKLNDCQAFKTIGMLKIRVKEFLIVYQEYKLCFNAYCVFAETSFMGVVHFMDDIGANK